MKSDFRNQIKVEHPTAAENAKATKGLGQLLAHFFKTKTSLRGGAYQALASELDIDLKSFPHVQWAFPKVIDQEMRYMVPGPKGFLGSAFKVLEPLDDGATAVNIADLDFVLVPGVAFSVMGERLGRGLGYFDRALAGYRGAKIGVAKQDRVYNEIPTEEHDVKVHGLVTPLGVLQFAGGTTWRQ